MKLPDNAIKKIDRPDLMETFVDSLGMTTFDGQTARVELCVTRMDEPKPPAQPTAKRYPAIRLVLTPEALADLFNGLNKLMAALKQAGVVKDIPSGPLPGLGGGPAH